MRRLRRRVQHALLAGPQWLAVALAWWAVPRLSRRRIATLARWMGAVACSVARRDRRIVNANLDLVFGPAPSVSERKRLVRAIFDHAALVLLDFFWFSRSGRERALRHVSFDKRVWALIEGDAPMLIVTGHIGVWELLPQIVAAQGREITSVFAPIGASVTQRRMAEMRKGEGQHVVPREGAVLALLRVVHKRQLIGLLLDQYTPVTQGGVFVDFMGRQAAISKVAGTLSTRLNVAVVAVRCLHVGDGNYHAEVLQTLPAGHGLDEVGVTQWIADVLGGAIRNVPEQWLWMYRRWRHVPPGADPAQYPFYSRPFNPACD